MSTQALVRESDSSLLHKIKKYGFIVFNVLMVVWLLLAYGVGAAEEPGALPEEPGIDAAFGAEAGLLYIGIIWVVGNVILALITWYMNSKTTNRV